MADIETVRATLARIDELTEQANAAERMHTHWMGFDGGLSVNLATTVQRRWRGETWVHSEYPMTADERELFRGYLTQRVGQMRREIERLTKELEAQDDQR